MVVMNDMSVGRDAAEGLGGPPGRGDEACASFEQARLLRGEREVWTEGVAS